jgi:hypothetical protein
VILEPSKLADDRMRVFAFLGHAVHQRAEQGLRNLGGAFKRFFDRKPCLTAPLP